MLLACTVRARYVTLRLPFLRPALVLTPYLCSKRRTCGMQQRAVTPLGGTFGGTTGRDKEGNDDRTAPSVRRRLKVGAAEVLMEGVVFGQRSPAGGSWHSGARTGRRKALTGGFGRGTYASTAVGLEHPSEVCVL